MVSLATPDLAREYSAWLRERISSREQGGTQVLSAPFLGPFNDGIRVYLEPIGGEFLLHDDGNTFDNLSDLGVKIDDSQRRQTLIKLIGAPTPQTAKIISFSWMELRDARPDAERVIAFPAQLAETFDPSGELDSAKGEMNSGNLYYGDNKEVLAHLLANGYRGKVDLIYIDPPFDSGADYVRKVTLRGKSALAKLEGESYSLGEQVQYTDIWANDNYLQFMYERLILLKELLREGGAILPHVG